MSPSRTTAVTAAILAVMLEMPLVAAQTTLTDVRGTYLRMVSMEGDSTYALQLDENSAVLGGDEIVVENLDLFIAPATLVSGETELLISSAEFDDLQDTLTITDSATVQVITAHRARRGTPTGNKRTLVVRVRGSNGSGPSTSASAFALSNNVFGSCRIRIGTTVINCADPINMRKQFKECSNDQIDFQPASGSYIGSGNTAGVITVNVASSITNIDRGVVKTQAEEAVKSRLGLTSLSSFDHVIICLPPGTLRNGGGWTAYAYINGRTSVYNDNKCTQTSILMHELGHNLNLAHSSEGASEYGDQTGYMGGTSSNNDRRMCFNAPKSVQLGWYSNRVRSFNEGDADRSFRLIGVDNYDGSTSSETVVIKVNLAGSTTNYYIGFNAAIGMNQDTIEARDQVVIYRKEASHSAYAFSYLIGRVSSGIFTFPGSNVHVRVLSRDVANGVAFVLLSSNPPSSCISGSAQVQRLNPTNGAVASVAVRELTEGDTIRGVVGDDLEPTFCHVETIGNFGYGPVYGDYTDHHLLIDSSNKAIVPHGTRGNNMTDVDKYVILLGAAVGQPDEGCMAGMDANSNLYTPLDTDFCGPNVTLSFAQYKLLYKMILRTVRRSGSHWLQLASYTGRTVNGSDGIVRVQQWNEFTPKLCTSMLGCAASGVATSDACAEYEALGLEFVDGFLTDGAKNLTLIAMPHLGEPGVNGSASFAAFDDTHDDEHWHITVGVLGGLLLVLGIIVATVVVVVRRSSKQGQIALNENGLAEIDSPAFVPRHTSDIIA